MQRKHLKPVTLIDDIHKARLHTIRVTAGQAAALIPLGHLIPQMHVNLQTVTISFKIFYMYLIIADLGSL